jgi:hypothetical protein
MGLCISTETRKHQAFDSVEFVSKFNAGIRDIYTLLNVPKGELTHYDAYSLVSIRNRFDYRVYVRFVKNKRTNAKVSEVLRDDVILCSSIADVGFVQRTTCDKDHCFVIYIKN